MAHLWGLQSTDEAHAFADGIVERDGDLVEGLSGAAGSGTATAHELRQLRAQAIVERL